MGSLSELENTIVGNQSRNVMDVLYSRSCLLYPIRNDVSVPPLALSPIRHCIPGLCSLRAELSKPAAASSESRGHSSGRCRAPFPFVGTSLRSYDRSRIQHGRTGGRDEVVGGAAR